MLNLENLSLEIAQWKVPCNKSLLPLKELLKSPQEKKPNQNKTIY
jgi:hypothetical protein